MPNRLADQSSPYLLQHASNPVAWFPWSEQALASAVEQDKPIFLSIGYSACHWCHVMEHESFEDRAIADFLNEHFVSIKVDREERPDLDQVYMSAVTAIAGHGGWPLSVFLTPQCEVFFGGTYWPPRARGGMPGFDQVLRSVLRAFRDNRDLVDRQSRQITELLRGAAQLETEEALDQEVLVQAAQHLSRVFDSRYGGFGSAPKFPHPMDLSLLLRLARRWPEHLAPGREPIEQMISITLSKMAHGGIYDHLGGGFARYSVDPQWLVPHFEKMLYDNALLAGVYVDAYRADTNPLWKRVAEQTLDYLRREMTDPAGGIYSTEDADSEGEEGKFYLWTPAEVRQALGPEDAELFCDLFDVSEAGNFEGRNILNLPKTLEQFARLRGLDRNALGVQVDSLLQALYTVRRQRVPPGRDDKVIVAWNALAIDAFARASVVLENTAYLQAAAAAAAFIMSHVRTDSGRLAHSWRKGRVSHPAYLDDYACLINGLVSLYQASFDERWIDVAVELAELMVEHFVDPRGGFFFTADDAEPLITRPKDFQDTSVPGGNSMAAVCLLRLSSLCGRRDWVALAEQTVAAASTLIRKAPQAASQMLIALDMLHLGRREMVLVADRISPDVMEARSMLQRGAVVNGAIAFRCSAEPGQRSAHLDSAFAAKASVGGKPTLYICRNFACRQPAVGLQEIRSAICEVEVPSLQPALP